MLIRYLFVWLLLAIVAIANGIVRQATYGNIIPELAAHQVSTITAIAATGALVWLVNRRWAIRSAAEAATIGLAWLFLTVLFEFGFGHYVAGHDWNRLLADYNIFNGRIWSLFLVWIAVVPYLVFSMTERGRKHVRVE